jgi:hypothetical protein
MVPSPLLRGDVTFDVTERLVLAIFPSRAEEGRGEVMQYGLYPSPGEGRD